jgi:hypothetical protein
MFNKEDRKQFDRLCEKIRDGKHPVISAKSIFTCPCCGYPTLSSRCKDEICPLCSWIDEGQDDKDETEVYGNGNFNYSLKEARMRFAVDFSIYDPDDSVRSIPDNNDIQIRIRKAIVTIYDLIPDSSAQATLFDIVDLLLHYFKKETLHRIQKE